MSAADDDKFEFLRRAVLEQLGNWASKNPDAAVLGSADTRQALTRQDIYTQVLEQTPLGDQLMSNWLALAARHVLSASLTDDDDEPTGMSSAAGAS